MSDPSTAAPVRAISTRALLVMAAALVAAFATLALVAGGGGGPAAAKAAAAGSGCTVHALRFRVTDDPRQVAAQERFERAMQEIPAPGLHPQPLPETPALHAVMHGGILLFLATGTDPHALPGLDALLAAGVRGGIPILVAPRAQAAPLVAIRTGYRMTCRAAGAAQVAAVRAFAAEQAGILRARP